MPVGLMADAMPFAALRNDPAAALTIVRRASQPTTPSALPAVCQSGLRDGSDGANTP